jgi:Flp pilus assembly protein TadD
MRLPDSSLRFVLSLFAVAASWVALTAQSYSSDIARVRMRESEQWQAIEKHLPDPATATPQALETEADILRARRFPEDALEYYRYALARGGNAPALLNKLGLTELEMRNLALARAYFQRVVKMGKKNAEAWNNLGAVEYLDGATASAVSDYKQAVKLDRREAVFHSNLASAYFLQKNYGGARREIATAIDLDPEIFDRGAVFIRDGEDVCAGRHGGADAAFAGDGGRGRHGCAARDAQGRGAGEVRDGRAGGGAGAQCAGAAGRSRSHRERSRCGACIEGGQAGGRIGMAESLV